MFSNIKAVLFDMDGTLLDSMSVWTDIDDEFFADNNFDIDYEIVKKDIEGCSMYETAQYFISNFNMKESPEELVERWNEMAFDHYSSIVSEKPGAIDFVKKLHDMGYKIAVGSSNSRVLIEAGLRSNGIIEYIDEIVTSGEVNKGKPAPDVYLEAARRIGVHPDNCIVFEDVMAGIEAGKNAGMRTCVIFDEYSMNDWDEKKEYADYSIKDYKEVFKYLNE